MKKTVAVLLCLFLAVLCVPMPISAADGALCTDYNPAHVHGLGDAENCLHENTTQQTYWYHDYYLNTDDGETHEAWVIQVDCITCADCGETISKEEKPIVENSEHSFDENGVCIWCGYGSTCAHSSTYETSFYRNEITYSDFGDNVFHQISGTGLNVTICEECGKAIAMTEGSFTDWENHAYGTESVCPLCSHVNTCIHEDVQADWKWIGKKNYSDIHDEQVHEVSGTRKVYTYCGICGQTLSEENEQYSEQEPHNFDEMGVCLNCGYGDSCSHENLTEWEGMDDATYTDIGDDQVHEACGHMVHDVYCADCGKLMSETIDEECTVMQEPHTYGSDNVCTRCGHSKQNVCAHEHVTDWWCWRDDVPEYSDIGDDEVHEASGYRIIAPYCEDCGATISETEEYYTMQEPHTYGSDNVCTKCGHTKQNVCAHEHVIDRWYWKEGAPEYSDIGDDQVHEANGYRIIAPYCEDCGATISETEEYYAMQEPHTYGSDSVCTICGHPCTHIDKEETWCWKDADALSYENTGSEIEHRVSGIRIRTTICSDCGKTVLSIEEPFSFMEGHTFDPYGTCTKCGYVADETPVLGEFTNAETRFHSFVYENNKWYVYDESNSLYCRIPNDRIDDAMKGWVSLNLKSEPVGADYDALMRHVSQLNSISFSCSLDWTGEKRLDLGEAEPYVSITVYHPEAKVEIEYTGSDLSANRDFGNIEVLAGNLTVNGNVISLSLFGAREDNNAGSVVTVNGDIRSFSWYNATCKLQQGNAGGPYRGSLFVSGKIGVLGDNCGTEYGSRSVMTNNPHIGDNGVIEINTTERVFKRTSVSEEPVPVILDGVFVLEPEELKEVKPDLTPDDLLIRYQSGYWNEWSVFVAIDPEVSGIPWTTYSWAILPSDFDESMIVPGKNVGVRIAGSREGDNPIVLNGDFREISVSGGLVVLQSGSVKMLEVGNTAVNHYAYHPYIDLEINMDVDYLDIGGTNPHADITVGEYGRVTEGGWYFYLNGISNPENQRFFGSVENNTDIMRDGQFLPMSVDWNGHYGAIMPGSDEIVDAAGLSDDYVGEMGIYDEGADALTEQEEAALNEVLPQTRGTESESSIVTCFEIQATAYKVDEGYNVIDSEQLKQLDKAVPVTLETDAGEQSEDLYFVVRLHENEEGAIEPEIIGTATGARTITIQTDRFSKYVLVKKEERHEVVMEGTVEWNAEDVTYKGATAYVIADGTAQMPRFVVKNTADGSVVDPEYYDFTYVENTNPGTGYVLVTFKDGYVGSCRGSFKIYLPATTETTVKNTADGILLTWAPVEGAAGYVIYRRAWSSTTNGWTDFARWDNTTETTYLDGHDAAHKVYAGTRYQYGVKAYFARRTDPVAETQIGGNVNDPSGNFNLGMVGPLKTTVRITTRELKSVTAGTKQLTVKWGGSTVFTGYQIQYATNSAFTKGVKSFKIDNPKTVSTVIKSLKTGTTYYVRIRSYHEFNGMTYYGEWSNVRSAKVK